MTSLLGMSPARFLRDYWQQRPLLIRQAIPGFSGVVDRSSLLSLATRSDVTSRLVVRQGAKWQRHDGPFGGLSMDMLPPDRWTLLVNGIESLVPGGWELLRRFSFIPAARIDDLMVSYAADGGSVGPHEDDYDVFLLQGSGRRRWQISTQSDHVLDRKAGIKVLAHFVAEEEWLLEPGDMLYLPPSVAHWGVAEGECTTYSIGFLAPSHRELTQSFLGYLAEGLNNGGDALLIDRQKQISKQPFELNNDMVNQIRQVIRRVDWQDDLVERFAGSFLTRPKPRVIFSPPTGKMAALSDAGLERRLRGRGRLALALPTRGLVRGRWLYLNGESHRAAKPILKRFISLLENRSIELPVVMNDDERALYHSWIQAGYLILTSR